MTFTGYKPNRPDERDFTFAPNANLVIPPKFSLRDLPHNPAPYDQLQLGTCVPNMACGIFEFVLRKMGLIDFMPSRLFVYALGRELEGSPLSQDTGMEPRDAFKVLANNGVCPESIWPYSDANPGPFQQEPSAEAKAAAQAAKAIKYFAIDPRAPGLPLRSCLAEGYPFGFGFQVPAMLESQEMASGQRPFLPLPNDTDNQLTGEGHGVRCVGWDFTCHRFPVPVFEIENSWNESWCDGGYFYMDYRYPSRGLATDFQTIRTVT